MPQAPALLQPIETEPPLPELRLLVPTESRWATFRRNLRDLFRHSDSIPPHLNSRPGDFWPDVFVNRKLPWRRFLQSGAAHLLVLAFIWAGSRFLNLQPRVTAQPVLSKSGVIYYTPSEYLPPLDTRPRISAPARKSDPEYSAQPVISVPPGADNHSQTVVTPPEIQLRRDVPLPNIVSWSGKLQLPIAPAPAVPASEITRLAPRMEDDVIAPPPIVREDIAANTRPSLQAAVIAPPPDYRRRIQAQARRSQHRRQFRNRPRAATCSRRPAHSFRQICGWVEWKRTSRCATAIAGSDG